MEAMDTSGSQLCQIIQGVGLRPRTVQCFQMVLVTAGIVALADAGFASRMDDMMVHSIRWKKANVFLSSLAFVVAYVDDFLIDVDV